MKLKAGWLATVSLTTLALIAAGSLATASQQMWNPEVAHAARVTASLLKGKPIRPMMLHRRTQDPGRAIASLSLPLAQAKLTSHTFNSSFSISSVEGIARQQAYRIKKLEFQLAQEQFKAGKISQSDLNSKATAYQQSAQEFKVFFDSYRMAD